MVLGQAVAVVLVVQPLQVLVALQLLVAQAHIPLYQVQTPLTQEEAVAVVVMATPIMEL